MSHNSRTRLALRRGLDLAVRHLVLVVGPHGHGVVAAAAAAAAAAVARQPRRVPVLLPLAADCFLVVVPETGVGELDCCQLSKTIL